MAEPTFEALDRLLTRSLGMAEVVQPHVPSLFEPAAEGSAPEFQVEDGYVDAAPPRHRRPLESTPPSAPVLAPTPFVVAPQDAPARTAPSPPAYPLSGATWTPVSVREQTDDVRLSSGTEVTPTAHQRLAASPPTAAETAPADVEPVPVRAAIPAAPPALLPSPLPLGLPSMPRLTGPPTARTENGETTPAGVIEVRIGRIEVRTQQPEDAHTRPARERQPPTLSLDAYLAGRAGEAR